MPKTIEETTALIPVLIAECVAREAVTHSDSLLPFEFVNSLTAKAEEIFAANRDFRKRLKAESGRDYLYMFMRHWISADLKRKHPELFVKLPAAFINGVN